MGPWRAGAGEGHCDVDGCLYVREAGKAVSLCGVYGEAKNGCFVVCVVCSSGKHCVVCN